MAVEFRICAAGLSFVCITGMSVPVKAQGGAVQLQEIVVQTTPVPGTKGIDVDKVPGFVTAIPSKEFTERRSPAVVDTIVLKTPGAIALSVDGSDLSPDLFYRGFQVSRLSGIANGLAVYQNGVRINEAFGDNVNLDLIPPIAIDRADVYTNNPIFGLNALGGAINFTLKNGFNFQGGNATILGGSYGRVNGFFEYGKQVGNYSFYAAADGYRDSGYRPFGAQNMQRAYADLGYRSQDSEIHGIGSFGRTLLGVQGVTPQVLVNQQYNSVYTTPQTTENQAILGQLTGRFDVARNWTINSNFYIRKFDQKRIDGNDADVEQCDDNPARLCLDEDAAPSGTPDEALEFRNVRNGQPVPFAPGIAAYGTTARNNTDTLTFGTQQQATNREKIFGHDNYFVFGGSFDTSSTKFQSSTTLARLNPQFQAIETGFPGAGAILTTVGQVGFQPVGVASEANYGGVFVLDTFNITKKLAVTAGARLNVAAIKLEDRTGLSPELNSFDTYTRINPVVGATYEFTKAFSVYAGYSEANRAPTPLETACADPARPCSLETALVADPPLQQVVSRTVEGGARGTYVLPNTYGALSYKAGYFHTRNTNDIISVPSELTGRGYFVNVPGTLRQGIEAGVIYNRGPLDFYANYAFVDATYRFRGQVASPNNPFAAADGTINISPGNRIPGIPQQLGKVGFEYSITPRLKVGMDTLLVGSRYFLTDDSNQNPQLPFYAALNGRASYQVTERLQVFVLGNNLTNNKYSTVGTFYEASTSGVGVSRILAANAASPNPNVDAVTVAQPISVYGGIKLTF